MWDTIWLLDLNGAPIEKDLLPPGSPFQTPGSRALEISTWLSDGRIVFSMHCGTGCVAHYAVNAADGGYQMFCVGKGPLYWAPDGKKAVIENDSSGPDAQGPGLVDASSATKLPPGEIPFRACKSTFEGDGRADDPRDFPRFKKWYPDSRHVLYSDLTHGTAKVWDTVTGQRTTLMGMSVRDAFWGWRR